MNPLEYIAQTPSVKIEVPIPPKNGYSGTNTITDLQKAEYCANQIKSKAINIAESHAQWTELAFSFADFGEDGRSLFHTISKVSGKYDFTENEKKFDNALKTRNGNITKGTFFEICKMEGIEFKEMFPQKTQIQKPQTFRKKHFEPYFEREKEEDKNYLPELIKSSNAIKSRAKEKIILKDPVVCFGDIRMIEQNTINSMQGSKGSFKSTMSELLTALLMHPNPEPQDFCGISRHDNSVHFVTSYVDTEREYNDHFPMSFQKMKLKAGFSIEDDVPDHYPISFVNVPRAERLKALKQWINHLRAKTEKPIFMVIDVGTDAIKSFNDLDQTNTFFDFLAKQTNENQITFLIVIHENPFTQKARGHFGSELGNKSASQFRIGHLKIEGKKTGLIEFEFEKLRFNKDSEPIVLRYDDNGNGLILAEEEVKQDVLVKVKKEPATKKLRYEIAEYLGHIQIVKDLLINTDSRPTRKQLARAIYDVFDDCRSESVAVKRLKEIEAGKIPTAIGEKEYYIEFKVLQKGGSNMLFIHEIKEEINPIDSQKVLSI